VMPIYDVVTSFGVIQYEADNIKEARTWAKKAHKVGPSSVSRQVNYKHCEQCDCKPCCCPERKPDA